MENEIRLSQHLTNHAFQEVMGGKVTGSEFDIALEIVEEITQILAVVPVEPERIGKSIPPERWEQGAISALESLLPKKTKK